MTAPPVALVIPTLDEAESIGALLAEVPPALVDLIIVADGGSTDGTCAVAAAAGAIVLDDVGRGYGRACLRGALAAPAEAILVFMDGDGADDPAQIGDLVAPLRDGTHDFVIGSRTRGRRAPGSMGWHQVWAGHLIGGGVNLLYRTRFSDMCAFRAIRREALLALDMREMTYGWNLEMQMKAARAGLRVLEVPVDCRVRTGGRSKVSGTLRGTVRAGSRILATFVRVARQSGSRPGGTINPGQ